MSDQRIVDELDAWFEGIREKCVEFTAEYFEEMSRFANKNYQRVHLRTLRGENCCSHSTEVFVTELCSLR